MPKNSNITGREVFIVDGNRTPFLKARGKRNPFAAADLAVLAARSLLLRQPIQPSDIDEVITGCVMPSASEANISRIVALRLGCGDSVPAWTVQRNCASGMQALDNAAHDIASGRAELVLAGGTSNSIKKSKFETGIDTKAVTMAKTNTTKNGILIF